MHTLADTRSERSEGAATEVMQEVPQHHEPLWTDSMVEGAVEEDELCYDLGIGEVLPSPAVVKASAAEEGQHSSPLLDNELRDRHLHGIGMSPAAEAGLLSALSEGGASASRSAHSRGPAVVLPEQPRTATRWCCGEQRLQLRQAFNTHEIKAAACFHKYSGDGSDAVLFHDDFWEFLLEYARSQGEEHVFGEEDLQLISHMANASSERGVSLAEALRALRASFAMRHMPKAVGAAFTRYGVAGGSIPSEVKLKDCMETLNDSRPVAFEEVAYVLQSMRALGAALDGAATATTTTEQVRWAVALWYLEIERQATERGQLAAEVYWTLQRRSFRSIAALRHVLARILKEAGEAKSSAVRLLANDDVPLTTVHYCSGFLVVFVALFLLLQLLALLVAFHGGKSSCEQPLGRLLFWTSLINLLSLVPAVSLSRSLRRALGAAASATLAVVQVWLWAMGLSSFLVSSEEMCGRLLWVTSGLVYAVLPAVLAGTLFCAPCCLSVLAAGVMFQEMQRVDQELSKNQDCSKDPAKSV